jgi:hypothetical protein
MPGHFTTDDLLIITKTYPTPSQKYRETTCVAALTRGGEMRRLFPVPFRLLSGDSRFKRWEWVRLKSSRKSTDQRPESRKIEIDSIVRLNEEVKTGDGWRERLAMIRSHIVSDPDAMEERRKSSGETLGFVEPVRCVALEITPVDDPEWSDKDIQKLCADGLFDPAEAKARTLLRKLPFDFHYKYVCATADGEREFRHKVTDWEFGALFWKCRQNHGPNGWENSFRDRVERDFIESRKLLFLMGTMHLYPNRWLIVGVVYPPKPQPAPALQQLDLGLGL